MLYQFTNPCAVALGLAGCKAPFGTAQLVLVYVRSYEKVVHLARMAACEVLVNHYP